MTMTTRRLLLAAGALASAPGAMAAVDLHHEHLKAEVVRNGRKEGKKEKVNSKPFTTVCVISYLLS